MSAWNRLAALPVVVEGYEVERRAAQAAYGVSPGPGGGASRPVKPRSGWMPVRRLRE